MIFTLCLTLMGELCMYSSNAYSFLHFKFTIRLICETFVFFSIMYWNATGYGKVKISRTLDTSVAWNILCNSMQRSRELKPNKLLWMWMWLTTNLYNEIVSWKCSGLTGPGFLNETSAHLKFVLLTDSQLIRQRLHKTGSTKDYS